jgi:enoyl-CoA hydratase/carnithine racemase
VRVTNVEGRSESISQWKEGRMYEQILYEVDSPTATIKLNRPDRLNAWTDKMGNELRHAIAQAEADEDVVVIVLTGEGRGFCAGADLQGLSNISEGKSERQSTGKLDANPGDAEMDAGFRATYTYLMSVRKPILCAINGACAGMAVPIALSTDIRFASDRAVFTTAFARRGLIAEWGINWLLPRVVGTAHALDLIMSGRRIDAAEAERMGLVNKTLPHDELLKHVYDYAREMAANCSPTSMKVMKRQVYEGLQEPLAESHSKAVKLMVESFSRPDFSEGVKSFMQKRPPEFERVK